jgi:hypothetical protein
MPTRREPAETDGSSPTKGVSMSQRSTARQVPGEHRVASPAPDAVKHSEATGWVAWVLLGGVLLVLLGALHVGAGVVALVRPEVLAGGRADLLIPVGLTALGWFHLLLGGIAAAVGVGLVRGRRWARIAAVQLACLIAIANFASVEVYPVWSVTAITLTAVVLYAVVVHGSEVAAAYGDTGKGGRHVGDADSAPALPEP